MNKEDVIACLHRIGCDATVFAFGDNTPLSVAGRVIVWYWMRESGVQLTTIPAMTTGGAHTAVYYACMKMERYLHACDFMNQVMDVARGKPGAKMPYPADLAYLRARAIVDLGFRTNLPGDSIYVFDPLRHLMRRTAIVEVVPCGIKNASRCLKLANGSMISQEACHRTEASLRRSMETALANPVLLDGQ